MNIDLILRTMNRHRVRYLLIGGVNFLLRHRPVLTFDVDLWIEDAPANLLRCETALAKLKAEWGRSEQEWAPVAGRKAGWLASQSVFCLTSPHGAIDIFREVAGLPSWRQSAAAARRMRTRGRVAFHSLSDADMLRCQEALPAGERKLDRIRTLKAILRGKRGRHAHA